MVCAVPPRSRRSNFQFLITHYKFQPTADGGFLYGFAYRMAICAVGKKIRKMNSMKEIRVFAPATVANMGCGFDIMGMTLDAVGDVLKVEAAEGDGVEDGIRIENRPHCPRIPSAMS